LDKNNNKNTSTTHTDNTTKIKEKQKNHQGNIHRTVTNIVYDIQISVFEKLRFPFLHYKDDSPPFSEYFHLHLGTESSTLLHDE